MVHCKHCKGKAFSANITRQKNHLRTCHHFLASTRRGLATRPSEDIEPLVPAGQRTIDFAGGHKQQLDVMYAMAIFAGARPFSIVDDEPMRRFISALNPIPNPLAEYSERLVTIALLQDQLLAALAKCRYINITVDESTDIRRRRIMNLSVTDGANRYHWCSKEIKGISMNATAVTDWIIEQVFFFLFLFFCNFL